MGQTQARQHIPHFSHAHSLPIAPAKENPAHGHDGASSFLWPKRKLLRLSHAIMRKPEGKLPMPEKKTIEKALGDKPRIGINQFETPRRCPFSKE
jgi:hypothetical protein